MGERKFKLGFFKLPPATIVVRVGTITIGMAPPKSKTWCFTLNNPEPSPDGEDLGEHWRTSPSATLYLDLECQLLVVGFEIADSGTPHLQGFVTFKNSKTLTAVKKIDARAHWEKAKQSECAANYCMKDGNYEKKDYRTQGARTDIDAAISTLREYGIKRVKRDHPKEFLKYPSGFLALDVLNEEERDFKPDVLWLWGRTGTGKSHFAKNVYPERTHWWSGRDLRWWQGYRGEDVVVIDDFRKDFCKFRELLRILDRYPYKVEVKGSHRELNSKMIVITTIAPPMEMYANLQGERLDQLARRLTKVVHATVVDGVYTLTPDANLDRPYQWEDELSAPSGGQETPDECAPCNTPANDLDTQDLEHLMGAEPTEEATATQMHDEETGLAPRRTLLYDPHGGNGPRMVWS